MNPTSLQERYPGTVSPVNGTFLCSAIIVCIPAILSGYAVMNATRIATSSRGFNRNRFFRRIATRYDKLGSTYLAMVKFAAIRTWMRFDESVA